MANESLATKDDDDFYQVKTCKAKRYGCIFCLTGHEKRVAERITTLLRNVVALPVEQLRHKSVCGKKTYVRERAFPGYVFVETQDILEKDVINRIPGVLFVLTYDDGDWELHGRDYSIAHWIVEHGGVIDVCQARAEGGKIVFTSGLLKDYQGSIVKVDKHRGNALLEIRLETATHQIWVAFDCINSNN